MFWFFCRKIGLFSVILHRKVSLTLRSPLPVAEYHTVSGVSGSATPTEIGVSPSAPNHPYCSVIDRNIEDDKQESTERENRIEGQKLSSQVQMGFQMSRKGNFPY